MSRVSNTKENEDKCFCPKCPIFLQADCPKEKQEILYCVTGKTVCEISEYGCLCGICPVYKEYNLEEGYFCLRGAAE